VSSATAAATATETATATATGICCVAAACPRRGVSEVARAVRHALGSPSIVWIPREDSEDGWSFVGWGVAAAAGGTGVDCLAEARDRADRLCGRIDRAGALPIAPRLFGGFAFDPGSAPRHETDLGRAWAPFDGARFVLPRLLFGCSQGSAFVAAFASDAASAAAYLAAARRAMSSTQPVCETPPPALAPRFEDGGVRSFTGLVTAALAEIEGRGLLKVVLCRTRRVSFPRDPDLLGALALLEVRHPACARFFFEQGGATFLGATPERLVLVRGRRAVTEALAGSLPRREGEDDDEARRRLLASSKDRAEHTLVVDALRGALASRCRALSLPAVPQVRTLAHVHHLATPITAELAGPCHVLDLAARLHPTPALCGAPRAAARAFLLAAEPEPRGWYGGGVGWIDGSGDGEIAVAIRSALVLRRTAWIYAGAGIVSGSEPGSEYEETTVKEAAMREALEAAA
jgi:menaquinone-specific isochorismate synthase